MPYSTTFVITVLSREPLQGILDPAAVFASEIASPGCINFEQVSDPVSEADYLEALSELSEE